MEKSSLFVFLKNSSKVHVKSILSSFKEKEYENVLVCSDKIQLIQDFFGKAPIRCHRFSKVLKSKREEGYLKGVDTIFNFSYLSMLFMYKLKKKLKQENINFIDFSGQYWPHLDNIQMRDIYSIILKEIIDIYIPFDQINIRLLSSKGQKNSILFSNLYMVLVSIRENRNLIQLFSEDDGSYRLNITHKKLDSSSKSTQSVGMFIFWTFYMTCGRWIRYLVPSYTQKKIEAIRFELKMGDDSKWSIHIPSFLDLHHSGIVELLKKKKLRDIREKKDLNLMIHNIIQDKAIWKEQIIIQKII